MLLNPVRAGLVSHPADWPWSSYCATIGEILDTPAWLDAARLLNCFSHTATIAIPAFRQFVDAGLHAASPWKDLRQTIYLGDESFINLAQTRMLEARRRDAEIPRLQRLHPSDTLDDIFTCADDIVSAAVTAYRTGRFTMRQIADHLGVHYSTISRLLARVEMLG